MGYPIDWLLFATNSNRSLKLVYVYDRGKLASIPIGHSTQEDNK